MFEINNVILLTIFFIIIILIKIIFISPHSISECFFVKKTQGINNCSIILYINLKNRKDRKKNIMKQIRKSGFKNKIIRVDAVKKSSGAFGCALSHIRALELAIRLKSKYTLILEDDFMWKFNPKITNNILDRIFRKDWDVCLLSCNGLRARINKYSAKAISCQTASGYIIKKNYIPKLLKLWKSTLKKNKVSPAIDRSWKKLQKRDKWLCTVPILGKQKASYSDIEKKFVKYRV